MGEKDPADELTLKAYPDREWRAAYSLEEEEMACELEARSENGELLVIVGPTVENLKVVYPDGAGITSRRSGARKPL